MFVFSSKCGVGMTDEEGGTERGVLDASPELVVLEWVKTFASEMLGRGEESGKKDSDAASERDEGSPENTPDSAPIDHEELMSIFMSVASLTSANLLQHVLRTSMCLIESRKGVHQESCKWHLKTR